MEREQKDAHDDSMSLYAFSKREILVSVLVVLTIVAGLLIWKALHIKSLRTEQLAVSRQ